MTVDDVGHLTAAGRVVGDDAEVVDSVAGQVVVHQTDGAVGRRPPAATTLARRLELHHQLPPPPHPYQPAIAKVRPV